MCIIILSSLLFPLVIFFISEKIKQVKEDRILFHKLSISVYEVINNLRMFQNSLSQFVEIVRKYPLAEVGGIGFPQYNFHLEKNLIPTVLYHQNSLFLQEILSMYRIVFHLNYIVNNIMINEIKKDFLWGFISMVDSERRYKDEAKYLLSTTQYLEEYLRCIIKIYAKIQLVNKYTSLFNFFLIKTSFSKKKLEAELKNVNLFLHDTVQVRSELIV